MKKTTTDSRKQQKRPTPLTFLLELPLVVDAGHAARLDAARQLYNAILL